MGFEQIEHYSMIPIKNNTDLTIEKRFIKFYMNLWIKEILLEVDNTYYLTSVILVISLIFALNCYRR